MSNGSVNFHDYYPSTDDINVDVINGLSQSPRTIPPKYFYDERGSELFELITKTKEYYPTRTEISILQKFKQNIVEDLPKDCVLLEPGGGSCSKVLHFIRELRPCVYVPMDISKNHLISSAENLAAELPWLQIHAICNDFTKNLTVPDSIPNQHRVVFFPGSSIGNFHPSEVVEYLKDIAILLGDDGYLLIGVDLKKDNQVLENAYDDHEGITAQFNLNLLTRINRELSANFDLALWQHKALYNNDYGRIEMHLTSLCDQVVDIEDHEFYFFRGETIHTENSYKYSVDEFISLSSQAGFTSKQVWVDNNQLFSVHLFQSIMS